MENIQDLYTDYLLSSFGQLTMIEKPFSKVDEHNCYHYDHSKGINLLNPLPLSILICFGSTPFPKVIVSITCTTSLPLSDFPKYIAKHFSTIAIHYSQRPGPIAAVELVTDEIHAPTLV